MRLKQIKLSGFKSFCDDTTFSFQESGISIIVGPNGCGKSNVVDSIRWVLGEQSPRHLRGAAMTDVIFAGSVTRNPVNRTEVTLIFDNSDGDSLEQYREFSEIAVSRRLYRSGESEYLINKMPVRLMDVRDLVADTGAGGRSYSIVEQGKVDEFITASPAERRIFMEEAAGIVRYKNRRIAAERKLEQTQQNLLRVNDVLTELQRQEESLRGQMEKARAYLDLKEEIGDMSRRLARVRYARSSKRCEELATSLQGLTQERDSIRQAVALAETTLERINLDLTTLENQLRDERGAMYRQEREIQQGETQLALERQNLANTRQWIEQMTRDREALQARSGQLVTQRESHQAELTAAEAETAALRTQIAELETAFAEKDGRRAELEARLSEAQERLLECHTNLTGTRNQQQFLQERQAENERRSTGLSGQIGATTQEQQGLAEQVAQQQTQREALAQTLADCARRAEELVTTLEALQAKREELIGQREALDREVMAARSRMESLRDIQASYEGLAEPVRDALRWIADTPGVAERYGVVGPLAEVLSVPEDAVDWAGAYLAPYLEVLLVREAEGMAGLQQALREAGHGGVRLWSLDTPIPGNGNGHGNGNGNGSGNGNHGDTARLTEVVTVAADFAGASKALFGQVGLLEGEALPVPLPTAHGTGLSEWLTRSGAFHIDPKAILTVGGGPAPSVGILRRRAEIEQLAGQLDTLEEQRRSVRADEEAVGAEVNDCNTQRQTLDAQRQEHTVELSRQDSELAHGQREQQRLQAVLAGLENEAQTLRQELADHEAKREALTQEAQRWGETQQSLQAELGTLRGDSETARAEAAELGGRLTQHKVTLGQKESHAEHLQGRMNALAQEGVEAEARLARMADDLTGQQQKLTGHEQEIQAIRARLDEQQQSLAQLRTTVQERQRSHDRQVEERDRRAAQVNAEKERAQSVNGRVHEVELELTGERMRRDQWAEQVRAQEQAQAAVLAAEKGPGGVVDSAGGEVQAQDGTGPEAADPADGDGASLVEGTSTGDTAGAAPDGEGPAQEMATAQPPAPIQVSEAEAAIDDKALEERLNSFKLKLERMAGVNLAAWEEYETLNERAEYLLQQQTDLDAAVQDLRESIRQMNQESRRRFKETFDNVNQHFQDLFPRIFGGGEARLVLTDEEDLLLSGVDIVAQPPGKKLASMNLLSGGEKALTAIAMIFAFFLNKPSPYCLLDEVDAPLDDVNVGRFNRLVQSMTEQSQFIIITHNKRTMEIGDMLYGVTMEEAGVSKVVSVDLGGRA